MGAGRQVEAADEGLGSRAVEPGLRGAAGSGRAFAEGCGQQGGLAAERIQPGSHQVALQVVEIEEARDQDPQRHDVDGEDAGGEGEGDERPRAAPRRRLRGGRHRLRIVYARVRAP